ncbi:MAG: hypothetical protein QXT64_07005 [Desulfurococcaceae archaeon]
MSKQNGIELIVQGLSDELKSKIAALFKLENGNGNGARGRPNILQIAKKNGHDPYRLLLEIVYLQLQGKSLEEIAAYLNRKYGLDVVKATVFNIISVLKQAGIYDEVVLAATQKVTRKVRVYYLENGNLKSDIDYIQQFIERKKNVLKPRVLITHLERIQEVVATIKKLPHEWSEEDIMQFLNSKFDYYLNVARERARSAPSNHYYSKLSESEIEDRARENVRRYLNSIRVILKWIGKSDLAERFGHTEWKRRIAINDYLSIEEVKKVLSSDELTQVEKTLLKLHITLGCREGFSASSRSGMYGLQWSKINWSNNTIDVFESKTKGGTWWRGCRLDLFWPELPEELRLLYARREKESDYILESLGIDKEDFYKIYSKVSKIVGRVIRPHFARKTHAVWLIACDVPLELIAGKPNQSPFGVGWEDLNTLMQHYAAFSQEKVNRELSKVRQHIQF